MYSSVNTIAIAALLSLLSGIAVFLQGVREERIKRDWLNFFTELSVAFISGATAYFAAVHYQWEHALLFLSVLLASNNGRETATKGKDMFLQAIQAIFIKKGV